MTFFFDNNLSPNLVTILRALGVDAIHLQERFPENTDDVDWLPVAGKEGWIVVTADRDIRRVPAEKQALQENRVTALFLKKTFLQRTKWPQAEWIVRNWRKIEAAAERLARGTSVQVSDNGKLEPYRW